MSDANNATVLLDIRDDIAHIILNRPGAMNALNLEMAKDLLDAAMRCDETTGVRAVVIAGAGKTFCAGGDVKQFVTEGRAAADLRARHHDLSACGDLRPGADERSGDRGGRGERGWRWDEPALACDLMIAAESARFTAAYTRIGSAPMAR